MKKFMHKKISTSVGILIILLASLAHIQLISYSQASLVGIFQKVPGSASSSILVEEGYLEKITPLVGEEDLSSEKVVPGEIIIQFKAGKITNFVGKNENGFIISDNESLNILLAENKVTEARKLWDRKIAEKDKLAMSFYGLDRTYILKVDKDKLKTGITAFKKHSLIAYAEPNRFVFTQAIPNDPEYSRQYAYSNIQAPEGWDIETGDGVVVAVIDTGVDYNHEDLAANMWKNPGEIPGNGIDDEGNGFVDDVYGWNFANNSDNPIDELGHGTHVSGTIAAVTNNNLGVAGTCWNCKIMAVRFMDPFFGQGWGDTEDAVKSLIYAANMGAKVINNSWGGYDYSDILKDAVNYAFFNKGALVVSAAGNQNSSKPHFPAAYLNSMSIGASITNVPSPNDFRAYFSNYGSWLDVAAPGIGVYSTCLGNTYCYKNGTSMATPHVSGLAGLIFSKNPTWTNNQVWAAIRNRSDFFVFDKYIGRGRINVFKSLRLSSATNVRPEIKSPSQFTIPFLRDSLVIRGTAKANYVLVYGAGVYPTNWIQFASGSWVNNNILGTLNLSGLNGRYTIRLVTTDDMGFRDTMFSFWVDTISPSISITFPPVGATVSDTIVAKASVTDNIGVQKVEFFIDGESRFIDTSAPYEFTWDTKTSLNGPHPLLVKAYDWGNNIGQPSVNVYVDNR